MPRDIALLLRRAGFGARPGQVDELAALGWDGAVAYLADLDAADPAAESLPPPTFDTEALLAAFRGSDDTAKARARRQARRDTASAITWWLRRMPAADRPLREKLTWFWHGHFATSIQKVRAPGLMLDQNQLLRRQGGGDFEALVRAVAVDPAMLIWLDGRQNRKGDPNENFAREMLELFVLGHGREGQQPYTEADVGAAARALTGTRLAPATSTAVIDPRRHDGGSKTFLGDTGPWDGDDVVRIAVGHPASAPFVTSRLWSRLVRPAGPDDPDVVQLAAPFARDRDVAALCGRLLRHPELRAPATRSGLVKQPVEWLVGCLRALRVDADETLVASLAGLGQIPFAPPSVGGWPAGAAWLTTGAALERLRAADHLAQQARPDVLGARAPAARVEAAAELLGIDAWSSSTEVVLRAASDEPRTLLTLALVAPENLLA